MTTGMPATIEADRRLVEILSRIVSRSRELQDRGRLRDGASRTEVDLLEHELREARARLASRRANLALQDGRSR